MPYKEFLKEYLTKGLLKEQSANLAAVEKLLQRAVKDLKTAEATLIIDEGIAYTVAYLAMLRAGRSLMLLKGFRPADSYQHKTVVEFMAQILPQEAKDMVGLFDRMRRKRNIFTYEIDISISKTEADNALVTAKKFVDLIKSIVRKENPQAELHF